MHVSKKNLIALIMLDVMVLLIAVGVLVFRHLTITESASYKLPFSFPFSIGQKQQPSSVPDSREPSAQPTAAIPDAPPAPPKPSEVRNIAFSYFNSKCSKVDLIGDFTNWTPVPMQRINPKQWILAAKIAPGEYAYNFVVDGRPIMDPNNAKVCDVGRGFQNSFLKVKSLKER